MKKIQKQLINDIFEIDSIDIGYYFDSNDKMMAVFERKIISISYQHGWKMWSKIQSHGGIFLLKKKNKIQSNDEMIFFSNKKLIT